MLPLGGLLFLGTELIPLFPHSEQKCLEIKKRGGGAMSVKLPSELGAGYRLRPLVSSLLQVYLGQKIVSFEFTQVPSNLPANQAVVIQQLSIG